MKFFKNQLMIKRIISFSAAALLTTGAWSENSSAITPLSGTSNFNTAAEELGLKTHEKQKALLAILHTSGYLTKQEIWKALNQLNISNPENIYKYTVARLDQARAFEKDPEKFTPDILRKTLFQNTLNPADIKDLILYLAQNAFGRKQGQEVNEISPIQDITRSPEHYLTQAKELGLVDRIEPSKKSYDAALVLGASRIGLFARASDLKRVLEEKGIDIKHGIIILAGERPLWAQIDGINFELYKSLEDYKNPIEALQLLPIGEDSVAIKEGKDYIIRLAKQHNIPLVKGKETIVYTKDNCPQGFFPGRDYPNYLDPNSAKLTETLMAKEIKNTLWPNDEVSIIDTKSENSLRPTTKTTAADVVKEILGKIKRGEFGEQKVFDILVQTNNPYIESQTLEIKRQFKEALVKFELTDYQINVEGVGFPLKQDFAALHSALARLMAEKWKDAQRSNPSPRKIEDMLYQTRDEPADLPPIPDFNNDNNSSKLSGEAGHPE